jgi:phosphonate transport system substrate-binding protein
LAQVWLDNLLVGQRLPPTAQFVRQINPASKLVQVVLPVFFGQCDACLATRSGFEIMCELNPQLNKQLKIIAQSPGIVPAIFCFRADVPDEIKGAYVAGMREMHQYIAGQQSLTMFHRDKLEEHPASCMQSAVDLVETHCRLFGESNHPPGTVTGVGKKDQP